MARIATPIATFAQRGPGGTPGIAIDFIEVEHAAVLRAAELMRARGPSRRGYYYQLLAVAGWTSLPLLPLLRQPTLLMAGDDDPLVPAVNSRIMHRLIARSQLHVYRGGHLDLITGPGLLTPVIERFLGLT